MISPVRSVSPGTCPGFLFVLPDLPGVIALSPRREFYCRVPASLAKDPSLSPRAKLLYVVLAAYADGRTGRAYVRLSKLQEQLGCGRSARERAQRELVRGGWLRLERKPSAAGRWGSRVFCVLFLRSPASAQFDRSGKPEQFFISHSPVSPSQQCPADLSLTSLTTNLFQEK